MTEAFYDHLAKTRHQIHQHPEVSEEEHETTVFLKAYLKKPNKNVLPTIRMS